MHWQKLAIPLPSAFYGERTLRHRILLAAATLSIAALSITAPPLAAADLPPAPVFPTGNVKNVYHGVLVPDPWRGLEDGNDPAVKAWSEAQNARARAYLDNVPGQNLIRQRLTALATDRSPSFSGLQPAGPAIFAFRNDPRAQQPTIVRLNAAGNPASATTVLDVNRLDPSGHTAIDWFVPSPDGSRIAVSLSKGGSEDGTLHVFDTASGKEVEQPIDRVQYPTGGGSLAWAADGRGFWYTRYPERTQPESEWHFNMAVYFHRLGGDAANDPLVLSKADGLPRTAEVFLDNAAAGPSALASVQLGDGGQWQHFVLTQGVRAQQIGTYADRVIGGAVIARDGTVYGVSRKDAPLGQVVRLAYPYAGGLGQAPVIVPAERIAAIIDGGENDRPLVLSGDRLFVTRISGGPNTLTAYDLSGRDPESVRLPEFISGVSEVIPVSNGDILYQATSFTTPARFFRWSRANGRSTPTALAVTTGMSFADVEVSRIFIPSKDGTRIPVNIIMKKGTALDGRSPLVLYGYGGFGVNQSPAFLSPRVRVLLDGGAIYAIANIRGGGEYGEAWHTAGMLTRKQNVFDDFDAVARGLIARQYTSHDRLALMGGSNGGLLMGATVTQQPDLARAVVSSVGIYDMLRLELDPNGAFNVTEYGSVTDPAQFRALHAYSPYHNVRAGTHYPAMLFTTGANDGRVNPMHSRKMVAALQTSTASDAPILLRTSANAGHGMGSSLDERIALDTDMLTFLFSQLGMDATKLAN